MDLCWTSLSTGKPTWERRFEEVTFWDVLCNSLVAGNLSVNYAEVCEASFPTQLKVGAAQGKQGCRHPACQTSSSVKELGAAASRHAHGAGQPCSWQPGAAAAGGNQSGSIRHLCLLPLKLPVESAHSREMASCLLNNWKNLLSHLQMFSHVTTGGWMLAENKTSFCCCFLNPFFIHYSAQWCEP